MVSSSKISSKELVSWVSNWKAVMSMHIIVTIITIIIVISMIFISIIITIIISISISISISMFPLSEIVFLLSLSPLLL